MAPYQQLEGTAEQYRHFLGGINQASLTEISDDFSFQIRTLQTPSLILREVRTQGQASNRAECGDAFFGLMLSHGSGGFSTSAPLLPPGPEPLAPSLHWHWPNDLAISHHRDSQVSYLRLESAGLLRQLALQHLRVDQLPSLQAVAASPELIGLISSLHQRLNSSAEADSRQQISDDFLVALGVQLQALLLQLHPEMAGAATVASARHLAAAIRWLDQHLSEAITLPQLAAELGLTPRAVQACFRNRLGISPMRWLKLARFSQLRRHLHHPDHRHRSSQQLKTLVGLSSTSLNRQAYREIYGLSPAEDQHQVQRHQHAAIELASSYQSLQFSSIKAAIVALQAIQQQQPQNAEPVVSITLALSSLPSVGAACRES
ncbi:MAG: helix-turn-helix domain-containing protein [Synechococcaceae cyanobacterium ELA263]